MERAKLKGLVLFPAMVPDKEEDTKESGQMRKP